MTANSSSTGYTKITYVTGIDQNTPTNAGDPEINAENLNKNEMALEKLYKERGSIDFDDKADAVENFNHEEAKTAFLLSPDGGFFKYVLSSSFSDSGNAGVAGMFIALSVGGLERVTDFVLPEYFGALGNGTINGGGADDTQAMKDWISFGINNKSHIQAKPASNYRITDTLWMGTANAAVGLKSVKMNDSKIWADFDAKPVLDLVGVQNGVMLDLSRSSVQTCNGRKATYGVLCARPAGGAVKSSGQFRFSGINVSGSYTCASMAWIASEVNTLDSKNTLSNDLGLPMIICGTDIFIDTFTLDVANTTGFEETELITSASGATATVLSMGSNQLWVKTNGAFGNGQTFANGETITGGTSGSTTSTNIPDGYFVNPKASPNVDIDVNYVGGVTATHNHIGQGVFLNNRSEQTTFPRLWIDKHNDVRVEEPDVNHRGGLSGSDAIWITVDGFISPRNDGSTALKSIILDSVYGHGVHENTVVIGDNRTTSQQIFTGIQFVNPLSGGNPLNTIKAIGQNVLINDPVFHVTAGIDLGTTNAIKSRNVDIQLKSAALPAPFTCGGEIDGRMIARSNDVINITTNTVLDRLKIYITNLGLTRHPPRKVAAVTANTITINGPHMTVNNTTATTNINKFDIPSGWQDGFEFVLEKLNANTVNILINGANSGTAKGVLGDVDIVLSMDSFAKFRYDKIRDRVRHIV